MNKLQAEALVQAGVREGLLPADAVWPEAEGRPWPVALLTTLGAWLAAVPMAGVLFLLMGERLEHGAGLYVMGALLLLGSGVALQSRSVPAFVEQLAVPGLLAGGAALGMALARDVSPTVAYGALGLLALAVALWVRAGWLRALLGAGACVLLARAVMFTGWPQAPHTGIEPRWLAWHLAGAAWGLALHLQARLGFDGHGGKVLGALEPVAAGWLLAMLVGLATWAGDSFLITGALGGGLAGHGGPVGNDASAWNAARAAQAATSAAMAAWGAWIALHRWPGLRRTTHVAAAAVGVLLAGLMPTLGAVWWVLALTLTSGRRRLAAAATLAALWIVGAFMTPWRGPWPPKPRCWGPLAWRWRPWRCAPAAVFFRTVRRPQPLRAEHGGGWRPPPWRRWRW